MTSEPAPCGLATPVVSPAGLLVFKVPQSGQEFRWFRKTGLVSEKPAQD